MRPLDLLRSFVSLTLCAATWAMDPTDTIMDAGKSSSMGLDDSLCCTRRRC